MSTMIAEVYDALIAAGVGEEKSRAAAQAVAHLEPGKYVTAADHKSDLEKLTTKEESEGARGDVRVLGERVDILSERVDALSERVSGVEREVAELKVSIANLRSEMFKWGAIAVLALIASQTAIALFIISAVQ